MRNKTSSSISYTGKDSNYLRMMGSKLVSTQNITGGTTIIFAASNRFNYSSFLSGKANMNSNRGLVMDVYAIHYDIAWIEAAASAQTEIDFYPQLVRDTVPDVQNNLVGIRNVNGDVVAQPNGNNELIAWEGSACFTEIEATANRGQAPAQMEGLNRYIVLPKPLIFVRPMHFRMLVRARYNVTQTGWILESNMYLYYCTRRVSGQEYRKLLDAYTQVPGLIERRE